jgi:hypothetical protein
MKKETAGMADESGGNEYSNPTFHLVRKTCLKMRKKKICK